jgi:hypothetical protein
MKGLPFITIHPFSFKGSYGEMENGDNRTWDLDLVFGIWILRLDQFNNTSSILYP